MGITKAIISFIFVLTLVAGLLLLVAVGGPPPSETESAVPPPRFQRSSEPRQAANTRAVEEVPPRELEPTLPATTLAPLTEEMTAPPPRQIPPVAAKYRDDPDAEERDLVKKLHGLLGLRSKGSGGGSRFRGALFVVKNGLVRRLRISPIEYRMSSQVTDALVDAAGKLPERKHPLFLFMGHEDHDVWYHIRTDPDCKLSKEIWKLTADHPNLFFLHWNPTLINEEKGLIGPRTVPIPHIDAAAHPIGKKAEEKPYSQRKPGVSWRGTTTGFFDDYKQSDRFRVANAFYEAVNAGKMPAAENNVKFHGRGQGKTEADVPDALMGATQTHEQMAEYKVMLDVDGNANAWEGLRWKLSYGAPVVKVKSVYYIQWYYPLLTHGKELWVSPIDDIVDQARTVAADEQLCDKLGTNARAFAEKHLVPDAGQKYIRDAIANLDYYRDTTRDWRIRGTPPGK